jgi:hypothetical protein
METRTPMKAIRAKCLDCSCYQPREVRLCPVISCALWPYRMGRRPKAKDLIQIEGATSDAAAHIG